nr:MAG TPA: hypothetical protein [Crassvirales sp.]DAR30996.1 MAG TPA: hypothetical protein [Caudoviricetes sp.]
MLLCLMVMLLRKLILNSLMRFRRVLNHLP